MANDIPVYILRMIYFTNHMTDLKPFAAILNPTILPMMVCVVEIGKAA